MQGRQRERSPLFRVERGSVPASGAAPRSHTASVTAADWYAVDSGLFATASKDGDVRLWDPNAVQCVSRISIGSPVASLAAGHAQGLPSKLAAGCEDGSVRLIDLVSGAATETLPGTHARLPVICWLTGSPQAQAAAAMIVTALLSIIQAT